MRHGLPLLLFGLLLLVPVAPARAADDPGRLPFSQAWRAGGPAVIAGPVITRGDVAPAYKAVAYATAGRVVLRSLATGAVLTTEPVSGVTGIADSSSDSSPGSILAVSDTETGVFVTEISIAGNSIVGPRRLSGSAGSDVVTAAPLFAGGFLWVIADAGGGARLWRVGGGTGPISSIALPDALPGVAPTRDGGDVVVAGDEELLRFPVGSALGPAPDVQPLAGCTIAALAPPAVSCADGGDTRVRRIDGALESPALDGAPGAALAVAGDPEPGPGYELPGVPAGTVVVGTGSGIRVLRPDLTVQSSSPGAATLAGAAIAQGRAYAVRDSGDELALDLNGVVTAIALPLFDGSRPAPVAGTAPAFARGHAVFAAGGGLLAYRDTDATPPAVVLTAPAAGTVGGTIALGARATDARGIRSVAWQLTAPGGAPREIASDTVGGARGPFGEPGPDYAGTFATFTVPAGTYRLEAVATDAAGNTTVSAPVEIAVGGGTPGPPPRGLLSGRCANPQDGGGDDDRLLGTQFGDRLTGGAGDDLLLGFVGDDCLDGGLGDDQLDGSSGADTLAGGPGGDRITGGTGNDTLTGAEQGDDIAGGSGNDVADGGAGVDTVVGEAGNDRLNGGSGADDLSGGSGRDRLFGGAGADTLDVGSNTNGATGGAGNDLILAINRRRDAINCGTGVDTVRADRLDRVSRNCERVTRVG